MGRNRVHELNRDHVAAPIADLLAGLRNELWRRFREEFASWELKPMLAMVFGSAARHDGGIDSDIDLLLVHSPFPGEKPPQGVKQGKIGVAIDVLSAVLAKSPSTPPNPSIWHRQVDVLRGHVQAWTGNRLQVVDLSYFEWQSPAPSTKVLLDEIGGVRVDLFSQLLSSNSGVKA
jgi:hypothetical protein